MFQYHIYSDHSFVKIYQPIMSNSFYMLRTATSLNSLDACFLKTVKNSSSWVILDTTLNSMRWESCQPGNPRPAFLQLRYRRSWDCCWEFETFFHIMSTRKIVFLVNQSPYVCFSWLIKTRKKLKKYQNTKDSYLKSKFDKHKLNNNRTLSFDVIQLWHLWRHPL